MNSSGIKRGLAGTAVAALAVTGLPFLASSASAASGEIVFGAAGPTRDSVAATATGGIVVLKVKSGVVDADAAKIKAIATDLTTSANTPTQAVAVQNGSIPAMNPDSSSDVFGADGYQEMYVPVRVDTSVTGASATYALWLDDDSDGVVDAGEARTQVTQQTSGAPATVTVDPLQQTAPASVASGNYTGTLKDSAGRTTQLLGAGESVTIDPQGTDTTDVGAGAGTTATLTPITTPTITQRGNFTFTGTNGTVGRHNIDVSATGTPVTTVALDVVAAAGGITQGEVDFVTGADSWKGDGSNTFAGGVAVRTDQSSVKVDINSPANAGKVLSLTATSDAAPGPGPDLTFGGQATKTVAVTLDGSGKGTVTFTPDAGTIQAGDSFTVAGGGFSTVVTFQAPTLSAATVNPDAITYLSAYGGSVTATLTVTDQFGTPAAGTYATVQRTGGVNADTESARKAVGADGKVTFTLTDTKATAASHASDTLVFKVYSGQFDPAALATDSSSHIDYTASGQGAEFFFTVDGQLPTGPAYNPNAVFANPLTDTTADNLGDSADESIALNLTGGTNSAAVTACRQRCEDPHDRRDPPVPGL